MSHANDPQPRHLFRIDRFLVPHAARDEFLGRVRQTHDVLRRQAGFVRDYLLEQPAGPDAVSILTFAEWDSAERVERVKAAVQAMQQEAGFDPRELIARLGISAEFGTYLPIGG